MYQNKGIAVSPAVRRAMDILAALIEQQQGGDQNYFEEQRPRYLHMLARLEQLQPPPCVVLDIGSHYLHQSILLQELGYEVWGIDIELFAGAQLVRERAEKFGINNIVVDMLEKGDFLLAQKNHFDLIIFTEILEHLTFNPIRFWNRVFNLLSPTGAIYLSTPNSLRPAAYGRALWNILSFGGLGLDIEHVLKTVTYGHHWKEYSSSEIRNYFQFLSNDFQIETFYYSTDLQRKPGFKQMMKNVLATIPCFRSDIEAVIHLDGKTGFSAQPPLLPIQRFPSK
jgi:2-polyprenyl-3-methyl-5-hydroxy-6-metoxy-1,4-benzoquinol methylase